MPPTTAPAMPPLERPLLEAASEGWGFVVLPELEALVVLGRPDEKDITPLGVADGVLIVSVSDGDRFSSSEMKKPELQIPPPNWSSAVPSGFTM